MFFFIPSLPCKSARAHQCQSFWPRISPQWHSQSQIGGRAFPDQLSVNSFPQSVMASHTANFPHSPLRLRRDRAQELCESRGGHPDLPVPNKPYGLCGRKATLNWTSSSVYACLAVPCHLHVLQTDLRGVGCLMRVERIPQNRVDTEH